MAQQMTCDDHGEPGVLYTSTLQGTVETKVLCETCIKPWAIALVDALGLLPALRESIAAELAEEARATAKKKPAKKAAAPPAEHDQAQEADLELSPAQLAEGEA